MAVERLPFEIAKPSNNTYVTQSSQIGHNGRSLAQALRFFIDDASGDICFVDGNNYIIFRLSSNGAEAKQFRVLNSSGVLIGTIDSSFLSSVLKASDVKNNLTSTNTDKPLSAKQGKVLKELIDTLTESVSGLAEEVSSINVIRDNESGDICFIDSDGYVITKISALGLETLGLHLKSNGGGESSSVVRNDDGFFITDSAGRIAFMVSNAGVIDGKTLGDNLKQAVAEAAGASIHKEMIVLGSSSVWGGGSQSLRNASYGISMLQSKGFDTSGFDTSVSGLMPFWKILNYLIGDSVNIVGLGVGGENIMAISARYGNYPALLQNDVVLPISHSDKVLIASEPDDTFLLSSYDGSSHCFPLLQGGVTQINPCFVDGIECELTCTFDSGYTNRKYFLNRVTDGDRQYTIKSGTMIVPHNAQINRKKDFAIICNWYNGGYSVNAQLVEMIQSTIENADCKDYIVLDKYAETESGGSAREAALAKAFGDRYINFRKYLTSNGLYDLGITPTTDADFTSEQLEHGVKSDTYQMSIGGFPSSLWYKVYGEEEQTANDSAHMNRCGYMLLAYKIWERMVALGVIEDTRSNS